MAHAGGAAGGGGAGGGGGEHDVPDLRFLVSPTSVGKWYFEEERTVGELEALLIQYLRSVNVSEEELDDEFPVTEQLNRQRPVVVTLNARAGRLKVAVRRKRRFCIFLMVMLDTFGQGKFKDLEVPHKYRDTSQLRGDIKALVEGIRSLTADLLDVCQQVKKKGGKPIKIPKIFEEEVDWPNVKK